MTEQDILGGPELPRARRAWPTVSQFGGKLGLIVIAIGLLVVGIGWNGAAGSGGEIDRVPVLQAQLPWLLSGGFLGLAIVVVGAALLIAHGHREDRVRLEARLVELVAAVQGQGPGRAPVAAAPADVRGLVVAGTASYHEPRCRLAEAREDAELLTAEEAAARGLSPCRICRPQPAVSAG
ncbi:MAG: hypothetical protein ACYDAQ_04850 [Mycobacteriales bacterium]